MSLDLLDRAKDELEHGDDELDAAAMLPAVVDALERAYAALAWCWFVGMALGSEIRRLEAPTASQIIVQRINTAIGGDSDDKASSSLVARFPEGKVLLEKKVTREEVLGLATEVKPKDAEQARILERLKATLARER